MSTFRGFIAIDIGSFPKLIELESEINKTGAHLKLVKPDNVHITLKFLGETEKGLIDEIEDIIKNAVEGVDPFNIKLVGTGVFPNPNYIKVVWIGIKQCELIGEIAQKIDESLSKLRFKREKRGFSPHLTVARVKSAKNKDQLMKIIEKNRDVEFADISVNSIKLMKSELTPKGPIYTVLKDVIF